MNATQFQQFIYEKGRELYRDMPWRRDVRSYYILVSELMLQQTQVSRVIPKFQQFIATMPDVATLADAPLVDVLALWQGLGYNRRAKYLWQSAQIIQHSFNGTFPDSRAGVLRLPGVGENTAGAILAYAYNQPSIFIETNIRTVYIHHFFNDVDSVSDADIREVLQATLDQENPRQFYWSLMDYGAHLKVQGVKTNIRSAHYKKQPPLAGSVRQVRGQILRVLTGAGEMAEIELREAILADERYPLALQGLMRDGLITVDAASGTVVIAQSIDKM